MESFFIEENHRSAGSNKFLWAIGLATILYSAKNCFRGVSFGKCVLGIRVGDLDNPNRAPALWRLFLRNLPLFI